MAQLDLVRAAATALGRPVEFGLRVHVISRDTAEQTWAEADRLLSGVDPKAVLAAQERFREHDSVGGILIDFFARPDVQERLASSISLLKFLEQQPRKKTSSEPESPADFVNRQIQRVREGAPTHELHRIILEARGVTPDKKSREYTDRVTKYIGSTPNPTADPDMDDEPKGPGGPAKGVEELIARIQQIWAFDEASMEHYLQFTPERGVQPQSPDLE